MQPHRPWLLPLFISVWALIQLLITTLHPSLQAISGISDTRLALLLGGVHLGFSVAIGVVFVGSCQLRPLAVRLCITALVVCPWLFFRLLLADPVAPIQLNVRTAAELALLVLINGLAIAYFLRPTVRLFWSSKAAATSQRAS